MSVHVIADTDAKLRATRSILKQQFRVTSEPLGAARSIPSGVEAVVVAADLRIVNNISALKALSSKLTSIPERIFLIDQGTRVATVQANALGATQVLVNPVAPAELLATVAGPEAGSISPGRPLSKGQQAAESGAASIASMFSAVMCGAPVDLRDAKKAGGEIANSIAEHGLSEWLTTVRRHHEGTYQHCLLVTGVAADFGLSLGMAKADIERLYTAAMLHDIGKAKIPLAVLDKPGRLDDRERALIETHPGAGYDALKGNPGVAPEILDAVRHHHEYLDGSGYPDGLCAESIADLVRVLTISDIFAALIEERVYKPTMPREKAYEILLGMEGKLEKPLIVAFRSVALSR